MYLLIDNYDSFTYNFYALMKKCSVDVKVVKNDEFFVPENLEGIVISPGPSNPENSGYSLKYLEKFSGNIPFFGVCLGMQCIGYFLGYKVDKSKTVMHGKVDYILHKENSVIFQGIESRFKSVRYHSLSVKVPADDKIITATAESDMEIMALEDVEKKLFGVQFHPESFLSENGEKIFKNFLKFADNI